MTLLHCSAWVQEGAAPIWVYDQSNTKKAAPKKGITKTAQSITGNMYFIIILYDECRHQVDGD